MVKTACSVQYIARDFPSSTALYLLSNDTEDHKKEAYNNSFKWFYWGALAKSKNSSNGF